MSILPYKDYACPIDEAFHPSFQAQRLSLNFNAILRRRELPLTANVLPEIMHAEQTYELAN